MTAAYDMGLPSSHPSAYRRGGRVRRHLAALGIRPAKLPKGALKVEPREVAENPILVAWKRAQERPGE